MSLLKTLSIAVLMLVILVSGFVLAENIIINYNYSQSTSLNAQSANSVVYIQNGVSGVVSITDPFLNRTTNFNVIYYPLDTGSGFVVNSDGYIITALHVVGDLDSLNNQTLKTMNNNDVQRYVERAAVSDYISVYNPDLISELSDNISSNSHTQLDSNSTTDIMNKRNLLSVQSAQQVINVNVPGIKNTNFNATIVDVGNPKIDEDIALIKINTSSNLSPLPVSSKTPGIFDGLRIYGYPGLDNAANSNSNISIEPSSSPGLVTTETIKNGTPYTFSINALYESLQNVFKEIFNGDNSTNGTVYYGTTAMTSEGFSGGPVVNTHNNVIGIIIFTVESDNELKQQLRFTSSLFLSAKYIIQICKKNHIPINVIN
jgi:serine protease Do